MVYRVACAVCALAWHGIWYMVDSNGAPTWQSCLGIGIGIQNTVLTNTIQWPRHRLWHKE